VHHLTTCYDVDQPTNTKEPLHVPNGSITRSKTKALKKALNRLVVQVLTKAELRDPLDHQEEASIHLIHV
jgi:SOS response regulatory protein OraA/RecX